MNAVYSTLATGVDAPAVSCAAGGDGSSIRNSLIVSRAAEPEIVGCENLEVSTSALEMTLGENLALGEMDTAWFAGFNLGNFHLSASAPADLATAAIWTTADTSEDIDGDPRPSVDGTPDYAVAE